MLLERLLTVLGRTFIGAGVMVFLFVGYQLWGTNLAESRAQSNLQAEAEQLFQTSAITVPNDGGGSTDDPDTTTPRNTTPAPPPAPQGSAVAVIKIPKINLEKAVVEGTGVPDLKKGPGHYINTPLPGQPGNAALAGHRTTYGAPFGDLGELDPGDEIIATTRQGTFRYSVTNTQIVSPSEVSVLAPTSDNRLTLTTCHPKYSAAKRLIVTAALDTSPALGSQQTAAPEPEEPASPGETQTTVNPAAVLSGADLSGTAVDKWPAILWGIIVILVGIAIYRTAQTYVKWMTYALGTPLFLLVLYFFFENFSRLLPANA
jgi:sortase A